MIDLTDTFIREVEIESTDSVLQIHQCKVGDVGCVVWDAGIVLAKYLDMAYTNHRKEHINLHGKNIIELGAGTGIVGLTAACLGGDVTVTDLPEVIPLLEMNIRSNRNLLSGTVSAKSLKWGYDQNNFPQYNIILVGDCVYYNESLEPLIKTLEALSNAETEILLSYEERQSENRPEFFKMFIKLIEEKFDIVEIPTSKQHPQFQSPDIHILKFIKKDIKGD